MHLTMDYARALQADRLREAAAYHLAAEARRARPRRQPTYRRPCNQSWAMDVSSMAGRTDEDTP